MQQKRMQDKRNTALFCGCRICGRDGAITRKCVGKLRKSLGWNYVFAPIILKTGLPEFVL